jgi:hypothetical protein
LGAKFCFFTNPAKLKPQSAAGAFGPLAADQGKDRFRVTHRHEIVPGGSPAIAVCDGILCAQSEDSGALTLILKPSQAPPFEAPAVSYFLYKGIDPASLLSGDDVLDEGAAAANDLTKRVAATWKDQNGGVLTGSKSGLGLDRDAAFLHDPGDPSSKVFIDADPIERLFTYPHPKFQLPVVKAGDWIGSFGTACGFEIVLLRLGYRPKLGFARSADNVIAVPSLPASNGGAPWQPDDYDFFAHWHAKEQAPAYMDPAAYFGAFVQAKLYKSDGDDSDRVKGKDVYDEILATFANRNVAWLDIRNNYGYSYNLFGFYGDTLRFASRQDSSQSVDLDFRSGAWPLLRLEIADVAGGRLGPLHRTSLRLPAGLSTAPTVLISKGHAKRLGPEPPKMRVPAIEPDAGDPLFLTPIRIAFPAIKDGTQEVLTASYTRLNLYERGKVGAQPPGGLGVAAGSYLDGLLRVQDMQLDKDFAGASLRFNIYHEEILVDLRSRYGPIYAASVGIAEDAASITLFAYPSHYLPSAYRAPGRQPLPSWADSADGSTELFVSRLAQTFHRTTINRKTITPLGATHDVDTLLVRHEPSTEVVDDNRLEDFCMLVLSRADHQSLLAEIAADPLADPTLPAFLTVAASTRQHDPGHDQGYVEIALRCTGFATGGPGKAVVHHTPLAHKSYEHADS